MDLDEHVVWLLSALRQAQGTSEINENKLIQNVNNCFLRVKKEVKGSGVPASKTSMQIEDFQAEAALLMLLCLPEIRGLERVESCKGLQSVNSYLPQLSDSVFFTVVRTHKLYFLVFPLLSRLPPDVVTALATAYFHHINNVTPVTLKISVELLKSLLYSHQYRQTHDGNSQSNAECLKLLVKFFSLKNVCSETPSMQKLSGYFFMYMFESLYLLMTAYIGDRIEDPDTYSCIEVWTELWKTENTITEEVPLSYTKETIMSMLTLCQNNCREMTLGMWMDWSEQLLPQHHPGHHPGKGRVKSIQVAASNIAFGIIRLLEAHSHLEEDLAISEHQRLLQFLKEVAADPDYDIDQDLPLQLLIEEINVKDERQGKLLGYLAQRDGLIASNDACSCLKQHAAALDTHTKMELLMNCIEWLQAGKPHITESIDVVLDLTADLIPDQLMPIIEGKLSKGLDEVLKTPSFRSHLTAVFNQLAGENTAEPSRRHVWLCLQSGRDVVEQAVRLAITMTGLVPVMVQVLADLRSICRAKLSSGKSVLASTLAEWQTSGLCGREEQDFTVLVKSLFSIKGLLDAKEVLQLMVEPFLVVECNRNEKLLLPLELLKEVMSSDVDVVVTPGPAVVSVVLALLHVVDATVCLEGHRASSCLAMRHLASVILAEITKVITCYQNKYDKEITLIKQMVCQYNLHPRSVMLISGVVDAELNGDDSADVLLQVLMKGSLELPQEGPLSPVICAAQDYPQLKEMSMSEWIITLVQVLPQCSESEWRSAFFLTDYVQESQNTVFPVLEVFHGVLHLVCESVASTLQQESESLPPPVSLHHCFTFFTSASMVYLEEKFQKQNSRERFVNIANIFRWWCCAAPSFCCNPELPTVFLARLCGALEDLVMSGRLQVQHEAHTQTPTAHGKDIEAQSLPKEQIDKLNVEASGKKENQRDEMVMCRKPREGCDTSRMDMKKELQHMTFFMVKHVPLSNLLASVASKLQKLYEM